MGARVPETRIVEAEASHELFSLGRENGGFEQVLTWKVDGAGCAAEHPPRAEGVWGLLGGDAALVEPALAGRRRLVCIYGGRACHRRVLQEVATRAVQEFIQRAEALAAVRLFSLRVALLECGLRDSSANIVHDLMGQQIIDAAGITQDSIDNITTPLTPDALQKIADISDNRPIPDAEGSGHFVFQLEARHANDFGSLTIVSAASMEGEAQSDVGGAGRCQGARGTVAECLGSLTRLRSVVSTFTQRGDPSDASLRPASSLLFLVPADAPPQSHCAAVAQECSRLRERRNLLLLWEGQEQRLHLPVVATPPRHLPERLCVLPSPPGSGPPSWNGSYTPSGLSSPEQLHTGRTTMIRAPSGKPGPVMAAEIGAGTRIRTSGTTAEADASVMAGGATPVNGTGKMSPRWSLGVCKQPPEGAMQLLQRLATSSVAFDAEAWLRRVREEGRTPDQQVQELLGVVLRLQREHRDVVEMAQRHLVAGTGGGAAGLGSSAGSTANAGRGANPGAARLISSGTAISASNQCCRLQSEGLAAAGEAPPQLKKHHSANFPTTSWVSYTSRVNGPAAHPEVAGSPQVPFRDINVSPQRSRSGVQIVTAGVLPPSSPVPANTQRSQPGTTVGSCGPHPVQVQCVMASPRKDQRAPHGDGFRSPYPAQPMSIGAKAPEQRTKSNGISVVGSTNVPVTTQSHRPSDPRQMENWGLNVRWDQASPCRVRYVGPCNTANSGGGTKSAAATPQGPPAAPGQPGPQGRVPQAHKGTPSGAPPLAAHASDVISRGPAPSMVHPAHMANVTTKSPTKCVRRG